MKKNCTSLFSLILVTCILSVTVGCNALPQNSSDETEKLPQTNITDIFELSLNDYAYQIERVKDIKTEKVEIPSSYQNIPITKIGDNAFYDCFSLAHASIPESITEIGNSAFKGCDSLKEIILPDSLISIGESAFENCNKLKSVHLGKNVTTIGKNAFRQCGMLSEISLPEGLTRIEESTFEQCGALTQIAIPNTVTTIEKYTFI